MTASIPAPMTRDRVATAVREAGLIPFLGDSDQVAAIVPRHVVRIVVPEGRPPQGVAEWPRSLAIRHAPAIAEVVRQFNATTYLPKMTTTVTDRGQIRVLLQHTFNWGGGATDAQASAEVRQFILASLAAFNTLDAKFPDPWAKEDSDG
ncbi:MAG: YbjN domain-containing protein [Actinomyces sp.]|nr:YbjN domain-containing protein [Actinomyces sp.]MCI1641243.1 YbjN domain-containing protein [Actinomyces sp.]MCI1662552.1 YbjN domain-containing protein [Actinomyces sp.]MCI1786864.1 YbjN domain-containing protein [Actinomyces sp.]MCI1828994.1 YbjN domain-containing protein [Actinomyces sp.]MCI1867268.1 YbjN domain-containing protein [Actinomyces sp.]